MAVCVWRVRGGGGKGGKGARQVASRLLDFRRLASDGCVSLDARSCKLQS